MANKENYAKKMDEIIQNLGENRPSLLLHACCGPCSSAVLEQLCQHFRITVLYYNPNIWPAREYRRRADELARFVAEAKPLDVQVVEAHYDPAEYYEAVKGLEQGPEKGSRCTICYRQRMDFAARYAHEHGFEWFTTTLSISPLKDPVRINEIGAELEKQYGVRHLTSEFRKKDGYKRSLELSREYGLYRQEYCGCEFSARGRGFDTEELAASASHL